MLERHQNDFAALDNPASPASPLPGELAEGGHAASGCAVGLNVALSTGAVRGPSCRVGAAEPRPPACSA